MEQNGSNVELKTSMLILELANQESLTKWPLEGFGSKMQDTEMSPSN